MWVCVCMCVCVYVCVCVCVCVCVRARACLNPLVLQLEAPSCRPRQTSHVTRHTSNVTRHTSHITHHALRITHHTSHITHHTSHVTRHTSPAPPSVNTVMRVSSRHRDSDMQSLYNARALAFSDGTSNPQLKMRWPGKQRRMRPIMHNTTPVVIIQPKP